MSMTGKLYAVDASEADRVGTTPAEVVAFLNHLSEHAALRCDLGKDWHVLHYLVTGERDGGSPPDSWAVLGAPVFRNVDLGYGPPTYLTPEQVDRLDCLWFLSEEDVRARFDFGQLAALRIYGYTGRERAMGLCEDEECERLFELILEMASFYEQAAAQGMGVIFHL